MSQIFDGVTYAVPNSYDGVPLDEHRAIGEMHCFSRSAVHADAKNDFEQLALYAWDGPFYWGVEVEALSSRVWSDVIAVDDIEFSYYGSADSKPTRHLGDVAKGMFALGGGPFFEEGVDVDIWGYRYCVERWYIDNLCVLPEELLESRAVDICCIRMHYVGLVPYYPHVSVIWIETSQLIGHTKFCGNDAPCLRLVGSHRPICVVVIIYARQLLTDC